jgi:phosphate transport system ATP-binding protein
MSFFTRRRLVKPEAYFSSSEPLLLTLENFSFYYGKTCILKDISYTFPEEGIVSIIGPSGCGKSTLLRSFNRMYEESSYDSTPLVEGSILLQEKDLFSFDKISLRANMGMVFQKPNPFPMSIWDNVLYGVKLHYKVARSDEQAIVESALREAGLWDEVKDKLRSSGLELSGGQ